MTEHIITSFENWIIHSKKFMEQRANDHMEYLVIRWHGSHPTWLPGNSLFGLKINSPQAVMFLMGSRKDPS